MALIRQTIKQEKLSFWKVVFMICGPLFAMNMAMKVLKGLSPSPIIGTIGGLVTLAGAVTACLIIIYKHVAYFNYKIIDDEFIMEKVFGKANHLFLTLKLSELEKFRAFDEVDLQEAKNNKVKMYRFVSGRNTQGWYVGEFTRNNDQYMFIIEPNEEILNGIIASQKLCGKL
ncbi:hypothetical protein [Crassaminicella profunda]|uniref:hypothetical protein n=1 Tax=Crassaminicella profunda TaxID=1286698 RepID=UPI001CA63FDB|nr:hypothetical protein [Crassaminicella profunda]QZY55311.1 hypothetical protein K7H06_20315 [Crassaminicella profunda]